MPAGCPPHPFLPAMSCHSPLDPGHRVPGTVLGPEDRKVDKGHFRRQSLGFRREDDGAGGTCDMWEDGGCPAGRTDGGLPCTVTRQTHGASLRVGSGAGSCISAVNVVICLLSPGSVSGLFQVPLVG